MSEHGPFDEAHATADEVRAALLLADVIDGHDASGADTEALGVVRLFEAVSPATTFDEIAARRLRSELTTRASRSPRLGTVRRIAAVAAAFAAFAFLSIFFLRSAARPSERVLVAREEAARTAVVAVAGSWGAQLEPSRRIAAVSEQQWRLRLVDQLDSERFEQLASESSAGSTNDRGQAAPLFTRTIPTPGGSS